MKAYKAFNKDQTCRDFKFEEGETYEIEGPPELCARGFHFCKDLVLTLEYYPASDINENLYAEVEILGECEFEKPTHHKGVTNKIKIVKFIPPEDVSSLVDGNLNSGNSNSGNLNSGDWNSGNRNSGNRNSGNRNSGYGNSGYDNSGYDNSGNRNSGNSNSGNRNSGNSNSGDWNSGNLNSGDWNSGDWNSGNRNSGDWNSGDWNSGNLNSGDWNSCNRETGFFNSESNEIINVFNKPCKLGEWETAEKPNFLYFETGSSYKESFQKSFESATAEDIELLKALPNFDADVFFEISGIKIEQNSKDDTK